jgi:hypothetical protein
MKRARLSRVLPIVPLSLLLGACEQDTQEAGRCLHHYQGDFGNHTKWGPCPAEWPPRPWEDAGR